MVIFNSQCPYTVSVIISDDNVSGATISMNFNYTYTRMLCVNQRILLSIHPVTIYKGGQIKIYGNRNMGYLNFPSGNPLK